MMCRIISRLFGTANNSDVVLRYEQTEGRKPEVVLKLKDTNNVVTPRGAIRGQQDTRTRQVRQVSDVTVTFLHVFERKRNK